MGCSAGGRQGLKAAQRFPEDFDGIVAGAPALNTTGRAAYAISVAQNLHKDEAGYIPATKYPAIHDAVLQACDALDGVTDRVIENPRQCKFDPKVLQCKAGEDTAACLTEPQVESARKMYTPVVNSRTEETIFPGLEYGSELGWSTFGGPQPFGIGVQMYQHMVFNDPNWDYKTLNFDSDMARVDKIENGNINAMDPNLKPFFARGGKLIQYHGWADQQIPAGSSVDVLRERARRDGRRRSGGPQLSPVHGARHGPLRWRRRDGQLRHAHAARGVGGAGVPARSDQRVARDERKAGPHASAVSLSAGGRVQGIRQHRRRREFRLQVGARAWIPSLGCQQVRLVVLGVSFRNCSASS